MKNKSSDLKIGFLGTGQMSSRHIGQLRTFPGVQVVAACGSTLSKAGEFVKTLGGDPIKPYGDFDLMLSECHLDALYVCIPPFAHKGQVEKAAEKGIHLFLEKPLAVTVERAASMAGAAKKYGVKTMMGYHNRFGKAVQVLKKKLDEGSAGKPGLFNGRYEANSGHQNSTWWRDPEKSGGQILEQVIHTYDLALYLMGDFEKARGFYTTIGHQNDPLYRVDDTSVSSIRFKSGGLGVITGTNNAVPGKWLAPFTIVCEKLTAHFTDPNHAEFIQTDGPSPVSQTVADDGNLYQRINQAFVDHLRGAPGLCPIEAGLRSLELIDEIKKSND